MKKTISVLLVVVLLLSLCACGNDEQDKTEPSASTAPSTTQCDHVYTDTVKKEATCTEEGIKSFACDKCNDTYTEAIEKLAHAYADATCTAPKTCTVCGATDGQALGHSFAQGKCARCGEAQPGYKALTSCGWTTAGLFASGEESEELDVITLWLNGEDSSVSAGYYEPIDKLDKDLQDELLQYPEDLYDFGGKKYKSKGFGDMRPASYTEQGDTVVVSVLEDEVIGTITMVRTAGDQYTVTAITGRIIDNIVTQCLSVGSVFTAK